MFKYTLAEVEKRDIRLSVAINPHQSGFIPLMFKTLVFFWKEFQTLCAQKIYRHGMSGLICCWAKGPYGRFYVVFLPWRLGKILCISGSLSLRNTGFVMAA